MHPPAAHIAELIYKSLARTTTPAEEQQLADFRLKHPELTKHLSDLYDDQHLIGAFKTRDPKLDETISTKRLQKILAAVETNSVSEPPVVALRERLPIPRSFWLRVAVVLVAFGIGYFWWQDNTDDAKKSLITEANLQQRSNDILPGGSKAVLTLSNGRQVELTDSGAIAIRDGAVMIENNSGRLVYRNGDIAAMNTMTTPNGAQYQLSLADGTRVWLNAGSSITYPTSFAGKTREVQISGEAYFEVKPDKIKPFIVRTSTDLVTVLGTSFNVNAYADEAAVKVSLVEGVVKVNHTSLQPGEAYINGKVMRTNIEQDIAWKNGVFNFNDQKLPEVMRQISRWYDVEVIFRTAPRDIEFVGKMSRKLTLREVVEFFNRSDIKMHIDGKQLIITQ